MSAWEHVWVYTGEHVRVSAWGHVWVGMFG